MRVFVLILALLALLGIVACGGGGSSAGTITAVTVSCTPTSVQSGQTSQCTATVTGTGTFTTAVTWAASVGSIDVNGVFTAEPVTANTSATITAISSQDTTMTGSATITVTPVTAITVSCSPSVIQSRQNSQCTAMANGSVTNAVTWTTTLGVISSMGNFTAPQVTASTQATITAVTQVTGVSGTATVTVDVNNTTTVAVDGGPTVNGQSIGYANGAYVTATVCVPKTTTCATIDHVLVDTGSVGFRVLSSALGSVALALHPQKASDGNDMAECYVAPTGYAWGSVSLAQVQVAGEIASTVPNANPNTPGVPIQIIGDSQVPSVPPSCTGQTTGGALNSVSTLKAKGILGIGLWAQDCGSACATGNPPPNTYYSCPSSGCGGILAALSQQVTNPVSLFPNDNNGSEILFPPVASGGASTAQGTLIFGIGTQPNNGLSGATVYTVTTSSPNLGTFTSTYNNTAYPGSISSGADANYFLSSAITGFPACNTPGYYCPSSSQTASVTNTDTNGSSGTVTLPVDNGDTLLSSGNFAFSSLAGPGGIRTTGFQFGMPFFYGRTVFTALSGASTPGGTGPYFAY